MKWVIIYKVEEMPEKAALYARVSTENQELEAQENKLKNWAENKETEYDLYSEKVSSIKERPEFELIMDNLEEYDYIVVTKLDRFARSVRDFNQRMERLKEYDTEFKATDQPIDTSDDLYGDMMLKFLALFAELERKMIRRRLQEGHERAKKEGRVGRPKKIGEETAEWLKQKKENGATNKYLQYLLQEEKDIDVSKKTIYNAIERVSDDG